MKAFALAALLTATVYLPMVSGSSGGSAVLPTLTPAGTSTIVRTPEATPTQTTSPTATQAPTDSATPAATGTSQPTSTPDIAATPTPTRPVTSTAVRRINAPHFTGGAGVEQAAVAWFGQVDSTSNYADVRVFFTDAFVKVHLHIFDRRLWYDTSPAAMELEAWDAVSLYLDARDGR